MPDLLLKRDEQMLREKNAHLLAADALRLIAVNHVEQDKEVILIRLHLGPLPHVQHILQRQRMQPVALADRPQHLDIAEPIDIQPAHLAIIQIGLRQIAQARPAPSPSPLAASYSVSLMTGFFDPHSAGIGNKVAGAVPGKESAS